MKRRKQLMTHRDWNDGELIHFVEIFPRTRFSVVLRLLSLYFYSARFLWSSRSFLIGSAERFFFVLRRWNVHSYS